MADGRNKAEWSRAAMICAVIAECHRDQKKGKPFKPSDFDPTSSTDKNTNAIRVTKENIGLMREAFKRFRRSKKQSRPTDGTTRQEETVPKN